VIAFCIFGSIINKFLISLRNLDLDRIVLFRPVRYKNIGVVGTSVVPVRGENKFLAVG